MEDMGVSTNFSIIIFIVFGILSIVPAIMVMARAKKSTTEYLATSGRTSSYLILAGIWANWIWLGGLLGAGEGGYLFGAPASWAYPFGWWLSMFIFVPLVKRLRKILPTALTHVQFMRLRFDAKTHVLYSLGSLAIILAALIVNLIGVGIAFEAIGNIPYWVAVASMGAIIILYVVISGMWAVNVTCFIQTLFLGLFAIIVVPVIIFSAGGPSAIMEGLVKQGIPEFGHIVNKHIWAAFFVPMTLSYVFFAQTDPSVWQKGFSVSFKRLASALLIGVTAAAALDGAVSFIGVTGKALLPSEVPSFFAVPKTIAYFAPSFSWVFLVMCLCAMLSTGGSLLNASTTYISVDILGRYFVKTGMRTARWITVLVGIASIIIAILLHGVSLLGLIVVMGVVISVFAIPVTLGLFWDKVNRHGVFWCTLAGVISSIVLWQTVFGGVWSANLWKILLINYAITLIGPVLWTLASPQEFSFEKLADEELVEEAA